MSTEPVSERPPKVTTQTVVEMKKRGEKISMLTAYDYTMAKIIDRAGIEVILVGDSASNVMAGHETTVPITLEQMVYLRVMCSTGCRPGARDSRPAVYELPGDGQGGVDQRRPHDERGRSPRSKT
jgi:hypothetical protein